MGEVSRLRALGILPADDQPPFDIIGDVHGCVDELQSLLQQLGYVPAEGGYLHPAGRRLVFVGDLVDRGPGSTLVLELVLAMHERGRALLVLGNHDARFLRWLLGKYVRTSFGLAETIKELEEMPESRRLGLEAEVRRLFLGAPGYLILDDGRLVVTHGGIRDGMIGSWNGETAAYCLYGEVEGYTPAGKPIRRDWAARRHLPTEGGATERQARSPETSADQQYPRPAPYIVYGHNVVSELRWVNRTLDLDTGCVYGGRLSALRYPELELRSLPAQRVYAERRRSSE